jgi:hypothetical protein
MGRTINIRLMRVAGPGYTDFHGLPYGAVFDGREAN